MNHLCRNPDIVLKAGDEEAKISPKRNDPFDAESFELYPPGTDHGVVKDDYNRIYTKNDKIENSK